MSRNDYPALAEKFEAYLSAHQPFGSPDSLYAPVRYINDLGGKRIRPVLLLMAYNLWHDDVTRALPAALGIEYFHNFTLMHDDIMDEAPLRRGKTTVHSLFGRNSAILSGDAMLIRSFDLLLEAGKQSDLGAELTSLMCRISLEICEGQQLDMDFELLDSPTESAYLEMIRKKTAVLLGGSLKMGAMMADASSTAQLALYQFGEMMGLGFQILDDCLDVFGEVEATGKQQGGDILRGKKNFLYVYTCNVLNPSERKHFAQTYHHAGISGDIKPVLEIYSSLQVEAYARKLQTTYINQSLDQLNSIPDIDTSRLKNLALQLNSRKK